MSIYETLLRVRETRGAGYFVLMDPDKQEIAKAVEKATLCEEAGVDALLVGGSLLLTPRFETLIKALKEKVGIPVIIFPGGVQQVSGAADAILFMSIISGRNPEHLIGDQVRAAPTVKALGLEAIATGYMLIESGGTTSAEYMSTTRSIPRDKPDIAAATALAAQYLGMKLVYLEAGSGAVQTVPERMISTVASYVSLPIIVGGGIVRPEDAAQKVNAGASFIVTGNVLEKEKDSDMIREFARAVHYKETRH